MPTFIAILVFIITILVLVIIHEFGHFIACKKFGVKVLEFGFGLPPRLWGKKIGETLWSLNAIPAGGFVRPLGEDEEMDISKLSAKERVEWNKRSFQTQTSSKKILIVAAGVLMNFFLAFLLFYIVLISKNFTYQIPLLIDYHFTGVNQTNLKSLLVEDVAKNSPAEGAKIQQSERILAVNDQPVTDGNQLIAASKEFAGQPINLTIADLQGNHKRAVTLTPRVNPPQGEGAIGIAFDQSQLAILTYDTPLQKLFAGPIQSYNLVGYSVELIRELVPQVFAQKQQQSTTQIQQEGPHATNPIERFLIFLQNLWGSIALFLSGPVGIIVLVKAILQSKDALIQYLDFVGLLSLNLAVVNVLPFPGLDGGRLFFLVIEAFTHKKVNQTFEKYIHTIGLAILLTLIVLITASDIQKLF